MSFLHTEILNPVSQDPDTFQYFAQAEPPDSAVIAYVTMWNHQEMREMQPLDTSYARYQRDS